MMRKKPGNTFASEGSPSTARCPGVGKRQVVPVAGVARKARGIWGSRMIDIQTRMAGRALELLYLPENKPCYLLDIGCGTGLSGSYLSDEGHYWVGLDISPAMLDEAVDREIEGDLLLGDMGQGIPFKPGTFDGCISISAVQWLCNANKKSENPAKRLYCFFASLFSVLVRGSRAVLQLYPENSEQVPFRMSRRGMVRKSRAWVLEKKERHRRQGREVRPDTQYTGRKRKPRF
ncbi:probable 18S rRNA (guanine-N(7))-methyltransferase isoform X2 [Theropithecus gelada]|uniref:probable 18S rRNA (guanine-N(7))-methyltransferase isoform X2 n=1 Tax=Theropithecus gelada TaxID=9565 RepID=UPI000DC1BDB6|nr:probable 18S rRNA (guanine-N(7))-methyltransferase isoform X2 [Theropithecus gelada]